MIYNFPPLSPVSLFTREWIEIMFGSGLPFARAMSPSLRGSGLKYFAFGTGTGYYQSPSLRGSGLK